MFNISSTELIEIQRRISRMRKTVFDEKEKKSFQNLLCKVMAQNAKSCFIHSGLIFLP